MTRTPLETLLIKDIQDKGSISIAEYMNRAMLDKVHGYYMTQDPLGASGDFTTAPEISQIFGELIGAWVADIWSKIGAPEKFYLVEAGPGRGTLMSDMLRIINTIPALKTACHPCLIEVSPHLRAIQERALSRFDREIATPIWADSLSETPNDAPIIFIANELLDVLPIHQLSKQGDTWQERYITAKNDNLTYVYKDAPDALIQIAEENGAPDADIIEVCPESIDFVKQLQTRMRPHGGAGLFVDYGYNDPACTGETLQALYEHKYCDVLSYVGQADISAHVNFGSLKRIIDQSPDTKFSALTEQGAFLTLLGGAYRAQALARRAETPKQAQDIIAAYDRLRDAEKMGSLFKVLAFIQGYDAHAAGF